MLGRSGTVLIRGLAQRTGALQKWYSTIPWTNLRPGAQQKWKSTNSWTVLLTGAMMKVHSTNSWTGLLTGALHSTISGLRTDALQQWC